MPEWPEMEHYRHMLEPRICKKSITDIQIERERSLNISASAFVSRVHHTTVVAVKRRAKMLLFQLDSDETLLLHLMLGGWLYYGRDNEKPDRTIQITLSFGNERLYFIGLRLGYLHLFSADQLTERLTELGPDPFDPLLSPSLFQQLLSSKGGPLKKQLTNQSMLSGIGNCYSDEICFEAGLLPSRIPTSLTSEEWTAFYRAMRIVLMEAVRAGGYMDHSFFDGDDLTGQYNNQCKVYDREGQSCYRCGSVIIRNDVAAKKSFCCKRCQR